MATIETYKIPKDADKNFVALVTMLTTTLANINTNIESLTTNVSSIKTELLTSINQAKQAAQESLVLATTQKTDIDTLKEQMREVKTTCIGLVEENKKLKQHCEDNDNYMRRMNLVVRGIGEEDGETEDTCHVLMKNFMKDKLKISPDILDKIDFARCHRLGKKSENSAKFPRPLIVRFERYTDRKTIWAERYQLQGTKFTVSENFGVATEFKRRKLYPILAKAKKIDQYKRHSYLNVDTLRIKDNNYTVDTLHLLPSELHPNVLACKSNDKYVVFGGIHSDYCYLSNYYKMKKNLMLDGHSYPTIEHGYQHCKALHFLDYEAAGKILSAPEPSQAKMYGSKVKGYTDDTWNLHKKDVMLRLLRAKFNSEPDIAKLLVETSGKKLAEAGTSKSFSIGITITNKNIYDEKSWTGNNLLGKCLEDIRKELV